MFRHTLRMRVFGYVRVSGQSQVEGDGFARQELAIQEFCAGQPTLRLVGAVWREQGVSGTVEGLERPAFGEMLDVIDRERAMHIAAKGSTLGWDCAVVVERMDRLARDLMVSEMLLMELRKRGIKVFSSDQGALIDMASDGGDPTRVLIRQIMGALSQWEKSMLVKKLSAAKARLKAAGKYADGTLPYGMMAGEEDTLNFMLAHHPEMNYSQITVLLNQGGYRNRAGRPFKQQNVRDIILNNRKHNK